MNRRPMEFTEVYLGHVTTDDFRRNPRSELGTRTATLHAQGIAKLRENWIYRVAARPNANLGKPARTKTGNSRSVFDVQSSEFWYRACGHREVSVVLLHANARVADGLGGGQR